MFGTTVRRASYQHLVLLLAATSCVDVFGSGQEGQHKQQYACVLGRCVEVYQDFHDFTRQLFSSFVCDGVCLPLEWNEYFALGPDWARLPRSGDDVLIAIAKEGKQVMLTKFFPLASQASVASPASVASTTAAHATTGTQCRRESVTCQPSTCRNYPKHSWPMK